MISDSLLIPFYFNSDAYIEKIDDKICKSILKKQSDGHYFLFLRIFRAFLSSYSFWYCFRFSIIWAFLYISSIYNPFENAYPSSIFINFTFSIPYKPLNVIIGFFFIFLLSLSYILFYVCSFLCFRESFFSISSFMFSCFLAYFIWVILTLVRFFRSVELSLIRGLSVSWVFFVFGGTKEYIRWFCLRMDRARNWAML